MSEPENKKKDDNTTAWIVIAIAAVVAFCWWQHERHQDYLRRTSPEQQRIDREQMNRQEWQESGRWYR